MQLPFCLAHVHILLLVCPLFCEEIISWPLTHLLGLLGNDLTSYYP